MSGDVIGWLGTGEMGGRIVRRLAEQGCTVVAWNRTRDRAAALESAGVDVVASPREVAQRANAIFAMLDRRTRCPRGDHRGERRCRWAEIGGDRR